MLNAAQRPAILADVYLIRLRLQKEFKHLLEKSGFPYATPLMGKCVLEEEHPQFIGLYSGAQSREYVRKRLEEADVVLQLGVLVTDFNTGLCSSTLVVFLRCLTDPCV
jgi:TPP-dependent 2-oxoacid decarboxylase